MTIPIKQLGGLLALCWLLLSGCDEQPWNSPYPAGEQAENILYSSFEERPKHLDPARSYSSNEVVFLGQIYEPPLQYHYLKRPYELIPRSAETVPEPVYLDAAGNELPADAPAGDVAYSEYRIRIRPGIRYQPHPAFAANEAGEYLYHELSPGEMEGRHALQDFPHTGSRELVASDFVYQIKRLAHPALHSPILGLMSEYIVGLADYADTLGRVWNELKQSNGNNDGLYLDLREHPLPGVEAIDRYTYRIRIKGRYPQMVYWLAMPFFAPVPWEVDYFFSQPGMKSRNLTLDWYPVGTGPYRLTVNNPNLEMVLERNPNFRGETYPAEGEPGDREAGLLQDTGKPIPFIDKAVFKLEKEQIPYWNKFLQGYYDSSGISSDSFDQAIKVGEGGEVGLTQDMQEKGIRLQTAVATSIFYMGFNMLDPVVGGDSERARKLRRAIAIAMDYEEFISIFLNGRGVPAQGPIPPGIFGHRDGEAGINPHVYDWIDGEPQRRPIEAARRLLAEAGYPGGRDAETGSPLVLYFDTTGGGPDDKARMDWLRKQFDKLDIQLVIRATDYNRFQDKMRNGTAQIFQWGWNADYPDPENFLFLLYGENSKAEKNGENAANYRNGEFDRLFERMKNMDNGPQRQALIDEMLAIARRDGPWLWGFYPKSFSLHHAWLKNNKPNLMARNTLKYKRIDTELRQRLRREWNSPMLWPLVLAGILLVAATVPAVIGYRRRMYMRGRQD
ncbi:ABC-type dipeptide transporter, periplasmic component [Thiohalobacter thiocyanaticus]|uniref:ABC-type dipeptide transporter, periplasmic component n=1 Tax=Thiohalobacter thiocyanaticus TaxID=585455 RepID=A0A1Z4VQS1_9GAMM|nr:ABC transporter substrate-binding protein [Thiohalobacter thiocyanaticus]BAZ93981.1 ABC-type dipeptide transporter, periplasmic component [Thiohalobacter thiocyanaticus]